MAEEDTELRDLIIQTLENRGVLAKIKAQLRAEVFLALDQQKGSGGGKSLSDSQLTAKLLQKENNLQALALVDECLQYFHLNYSLEVFHSEIGISRETLPKTNLIAQKCHLDETDDDCTLLQLFDKCSALTSSRFDTSSSPIKQPSKPRISIGVETINAENSFHKDMRISDEMISKARKLFAMYDMNNDGLVDKTDVRSLFQDLAPGFNKNMLEKHLTDEFRAINSKSSSNKNEITFDEFLQMHQRLFVQCKELVLHQSGNLTYQPQNITYPPSPTTESSPSPMGFSGRDTFYSKTAPTVADSRSKQSSFSENDGFKSPTKERKETPVNDYQDDFSDSTQSPRHRTPRSARSDASTTSTDSRSAYSPAKSQSFQESTPRKTARRVEETTDDIEEVIDIEETSLSGVDEMTVDRTVESDESLQVDYAEEMETPKSSRHNSMKA